MTKSREIEILDAAIAQLGPDSYLGPWLANVRIDVAGSMRLDLEPIILPSEAIATAERVIREAKEQAARIICDAHQKASSVEDAARERAVRLHDRTRATLERLLREV